MTMSQNATQDTKPKSKALPITTTFVGAGMILILPVVLLIAAYVAFLATDNSRDDVYTIFEEGTAVLEPGEETLLIANSIYTSNLDGNSCSSPNHDVTFKSVPKGRYSTWYSGGTVESFASVTSNSGGEVTIMCDTKGSNPKWPDDSATVSVVPGATDYNAIWYVYGAIASFIIGIVVMVLGIVLWVKRSRHNNRLKLQPIQNSHYYPDGSPRRIP